MSLMNLPTESLSHMAEYVTSLQSLAGLASVNHRLYAIFNPLLYQRDAKSTHSLAIDWAAKKGDMRVLKRALENGAEIPPSYQPTQVFPARERWRYGRQISRRFEYTPPHPLCISVEAENEAMVKFMLSRGSDPNMRDSENLSVLSIAVVHENVQIVKILLSAGANQFWHVDTENYPLQIAAHLGNKEIFDLLLHHGPQGLRDTRHLRGSLECALRGKNHHLIPSLLEFEINLNSCFAGSPYTPLSFAVESGDFDIVKLLLDNGANPSFPSHDYWEGGVSSHVGWEGEPALVKAVTRGDEAMVQILIEGSDRVTRTRALSLSMKQLNSRISRILLAHGCAVEFEDRDHGDYPCYHRPGDDYSLIAPVVQAINAGNVDMVRLLVKQKGASVNVWYQGLFKSQSTRSQGSALQLAIDLGQVDIIQFLRDNGAQEEVQSWWNRYFSQMPGVNQD